MMMKLKNISIFKSLFTKVSEEGKSEFTIDQFTFLFRYSTVKIGTVLKEKVQIPALDSNISYEDVESLVFDVIGLDNSYITQIEVTRETLSAIPSRPKEKIEQFEDAVAVT